MSIQNKSATVSDDAFPFSVDDDGIIYINGAQVI